MQGPSRLFALLLTLVCLGAAAFVLCAAFGLYPSSQIAGLGMFRTWAEQLNHLTTEQPLLIYGGVGLAGAVGLVAARGAFGNSERDGTLVIQQRDLGSTSVSLVGLRRLAVHVADDIPGLERVANVEARVKRKRVSFHYALLVKPDANVLRMEEELRSRLVTAIENHIGQPRQETRVDVHTRVASKDLARKRVR